jgi:acyl-homoserine-lactone acylase
MKIIFVSAVLSGLFCIAAGDAWATGPIVAQKNGEILWDSYGVPHIYAGCLEDALRGYGYTQMELHAELILQKIAAARGRSAEYFGPGANNANVTNDVQVRTYDIPGRAARWVQEGGEQQRVYLAAFVDGANDYGVRHGDTIDASFLQVLPLTSADILAGFQNTIQFTFMLLTVPDLIAAWQGNETTTRTAPGETPAGSNGWALAPVKTTSGNAILMGNPHLAWGVNQPLPGYGIFQWVEAQIVVGDPQRPDLNAYGVTFPGAAYIGIGFNDYLGWTHTASTIKNADLYELTLTGSGSYLWNGHSRPLAHRLDAIKIRQPDGSYLTQTLDIASSVHGPIVARRDDGKALALRVAGLDTPAPILQYWNMMQAQNLAQFNQANSALQMPYFNLVYADRDGHIEYIFDGQQPVRSGGTFSDWAGILPGDDPSALWTRTLSWAQLPKAIDPPGGFVQNANDPPWTATFPQAIDPQNYPSWIAPQLMYPRPQHSAQFLLSKAQFSTEDVLAGKESTYMLLADRILPDLIDAAMRSGDPTAAAAAAELQGWDRTGDAASRGGTLFERWYELYTSDPNTPKSPVYPPDFGQPFPAFRVEWSPAQPLETPVGLANPDGAVPDLIEAANQMLELYGTLDVAWGDVHRTVLVTHDPTFQKSPIPLSNDPASGSTGDFGNLRVQMGVPTDTAMSNFFGTFGDSYVQIVEFTPNGPTAQALLGYGNSSRPGSAHITDQLPFFDNKQLRPVWRNRNDVEAHTVTEEAY